MITITTHIAQAAREEQDKNWMPLHAAAIRLDGAADMPSEEGWEPGFLFARHASPHQVVGCVADGRCKIVSTVQTPAFDALRREKGYSALHLGVSPVLLSHDVRAAVSAQAAT